MPAAFRQDPDQLVDPRKQPKRQRQRAKNQIYCRRARATSGFPVWGNALPVSRALSLVLVPRGLSFLADPVGTGAPTGGPAVPTSARQAPQSTQCFPFKGDT